jgi:SAM-dependent methyltransferase
MIVMADSGRTAEEAGRHNAQQRVYFEETAKPTMAPRNTPYLHRHVDEALRFAGYTPDQRVLEVGCGMGRYTLILARRGVRVEGLDLSPVLLQRLQAYNQASGGREIPLHCADVGSPPPGLAGSFDLVLGFFALHHLHGLPACFAAMARLVRPGGRVVFVEPNAFNVLYYIQIGITPGMTWAGDGGIAQMRTGVVFPAMGQAGLRDLAVHRFGFFPPFLANRPWGARLEGWLERAPWWRPFLPFQVFRGERP